MDPDVDVSLWRGSSTFSQLYYAASVTYPEGSRAAYYAACPMPVYSGVDTVELRALDRCANSKVKCNMVYNWLVEFTSRAQLTGKLHDVPAPIISRVHQELSDCMLGFNKARKVSEIVYPFVFSQLTDIFLLVLIFYLVVLNLSTVPSPELAGAMSSLTTLAFVGVYEAARELEDPFVDEPNDLPLRSMLFNFNHSLEAMRTNGSAPRDFEAEALEAEDTAIVEAKAEAARERTKAQLSARQPVGSPSSLLVGGRSAQNSPKQSPSPTPSKPNSAPTTPTPTTTTVPTSTSQI